MSNDSKTNPNAKATVETIIAAIDQLRAEGRSTSMDNIRSITGGSKSTIQTLMPAVDAELSERERSKIESEMEEGVLNSVLAIVRKEVKSLADKTTAHLEAELAKARADLSLYAADLETANEISADKTKEIIQLKDANAETQRALNESNQRLYDAQQDNNALVGEKGDLEMQLQELTRDLAEARKQCEGEANKAAEAQVKLEQVQTESKAAIDAANAEIERLKAFEAEASQLKTQLSAAQSQVDSLNSEVKRADERNTETMKTFERLIDKAQTDADAQRKANEQQSKGIEQLSGLITKVMEGGATKKDLEAIATKLEKLTTPTPGANQPQGNK